MGSLHVGIDDDIRSNADHPIDEPTIDTASVMPYKCTRTLHLEALDIEQHRIVPGPSRGYDQSSQCRWITPHNPTKTTRFNLRLGFNTLQVLWERLSSQHTAVDLMLLDKAFEVRSFRLAFRATTTEVTLIKSLSCDV